MAPPPPPLPKMEGLYFLLSVKDPSKMNDNSYLLDSPAKRAHFHASLEGQQIIKAENDCAHLKKQLDASKEAWQDLQRTINKNPVLQDTAITEEEVNRKRQTINAHAWHYKLCLANSLCPRQCQMFGSCWKWAGQRLGDKNMRSMIEHQVQICQPERDMILRCVGRHVASVVESISSVDDSNLMDDNGTGSDMGFHGDVTTMAATATDDSPIL